MYPAIRLSSGAASVQ